MGTTTTPNISFQDFASFKEVTNPPHQVAGLYFLYMLDVLVDEAHYVSKDFYCSPHLFDTLGAVDSTAPILLRLYARWGSHEEFLDTEQRRKIFTAVFGSNTSDNFPQLTGELMKACADYARYADLGGKDALRGRVNTTIRPLQTYLEGIRGVSTDISRQQLLGLAENSYKILRDSGVAGRYGIALAPRDTYPYTFDANGDKVVAQIWKTLMSAPTEANTPMDEPAELVPPLTQEMISNRIRAGREGTIGLVKIMDYIEGTSSVEELESLIRSVYNWGSALMSIQPPVPDAAYAPEAYAVDKRRGGLALAQPLMPPAMTPSSRGALTPNSRAQDGRVTSPARR
jgi:hypothetical protein